MTRIQQAVYDVRVLGLRIRVIVVHELTEEQQNAMLLLFSANEAQLRYASENYRPHSTETSKLLYDVLMAYSEDPDMANILQEYLRERLPQLLQKLSPEERLKGISTEKRLEGLSPEERLEGLSPEERLEGLSPEEVRSLVDAAQRKLQTNGMSPKPQ